MPKKGPIKVTPKRRREPDVRKLGRALLALAAAQAEADALAEHQRRPAAPVKPPEVSS